MLPDGRVMLSWSIPYQSQFATAELAGPILEGRLAPAEDPRWREFGFATPEEYGFWAPRLCGIACLAMLLRGRDPGFARTLADLTRECQALGGYILQDKAGQWVDYGWVYAPMLEVARRYGLEGAISTALAVEDLCRAVLADRAVIASVNPYHVRLERLDETLPPGGHLVVVIGFEAVGGAPTGILCHNPSGTREATRAAAWIPTDVFGRAFAGRGILLWQATAPGGSEVGEERGLSSD